ncbi:MAG TPA: hypothetical protein PLV45_15535, partial [bacterium]|nr:hypothetical protein [bacterium]
MASPWIATFWTWDGTDWTEHDPPTKMGSRENAGIAYDTCRDRVVVFGGYGYSTPTSTRGGLTDTWEYYDDDWHFVETDHAPPPRSEIGMTFDSNRCRCVMFGGLGSTLRSDTWAYDGTDWTEIGLNQGFPTGDNRYATAYDSHRNRLVLFGGYDATFMNFSVSDLWEWDGENWLFRYVGYHPTGRADSGFAYDPVRQECVLYGGYDELSIKNDTWTWDGNEWTEKQPAHCPGPRFDMEMVYDANRDRIVLFGGIKDGGYVSNLVSDQTWEWDGTDWIQRDVAVHPPPCVEYGFAYDSHRKRCVLFGGLAKADPDNWHQSFFYQPDTWEWDGVQWLLIPTDYDPAWSQCDRMAYDSHRRRCVMFKNSTLETWEWDGADWHLMDPSGEELPETMYGSGIEYDSERREIILHNGDMFDLRVYKTWAYHHTDPDICTDLGLTLTLPLTYYTPGDTFYCDASICNNTGEILSGYPLFILLDVYGDYFWGPGWTPEFDGYWDELPVLDEGVTDCTVIPEFTWPEGAGTASGIAFVGCVTDPEI